MNSIKSERRTAQLSRERIDAVFEAATHQHDYVVGLHAAVIPDWDKAGRLVGHVKCCQQMWLYICEKATAFDLKHHAGEVVPGGAWMNWGFSSSDTEGMRDHVVALPEVIYKE